MLHNGNAVIIFLAYFWNFPFWPLSRRGKSYLKQEAVFSKHPQKISRVDGHVFVKQCSRIRV